MPLLTCECRQLLPISNLFAIPRVYLPTLLLLYPHNDARSESGARVGSSRATPWIPVAPPGDVCDWGFGDFGDFGDASSALGRRGRRWGRFGGIAWWMIRGACGGEVVARGALELARRSLQQASAGVGPAHPTHPNPPGPSRAATWQGASTLQYPNPLPPLARSYLHSPSADMASAS